MAKMPATFLIRLLSQNNVAGKGKAASCGLVTQGQHLIAFEPIPATITTMTLFDRLSEHSITRKDGTITKCMEDYIDGFQVCCRPQGTCTSPVHVHA